MAVDQLTGEEFKIKSKVVVNATGVFVDDILQLDEPGARQTIVPSQGIHLVLPRDFLPNDSAVMVPHTPDGRVMFAVPWHNHIVVGTTDTLVETHSLEPVAMETEIDFLLETAGQYLTKHPTRADVLSVFAGLRPLAKPDDDKKETKEISRGHKIVISLSGLITITGGKWTTYRKMAEDVVEKVAMLGGFPERECITRHMPIHGYRMDIDPYNDPMSPYGIDKENVLALEEENPEWEGFLSEELQIRKSQVIWAVREEMAQTVEDVLARRTRALFLNAAKSIRLAPEVAEMMAKEMKKDANWIDQQIADYHEIAKNYVIKI
jgi:glycerol-3-phosphate dehydrogenase